MMVFGGIDQIIWMGFWQLLIPYALVKQEQIIF